MVQARDVWDANRDNQIDAGAPTGEGIKVCVIDSGLYANQEDSYDSVMQVAAIDVNKALAGFSAKNDQTEIAAPGVDVLSTYSLGPAAPVISGGISYPAIPMTNSYVGTATAALVDGGTCNTALPANDPSWQGKVVLCQRGAAGFIVKAQNVAAGGGVAAVIYNNVAGDLNGTLGTNLAIIPAIPVVGVTQASGLDMQANRLGQPTTVNTMLPLDYNGYARLNGTSMATPRVRRGGVDLECQSVLDQPADPRSTQFDSAGSGTRRLRHQLRLGPRPGQGGIGRTAKPLGFAAA